MGQVRLGCRERPLKIGDGFALTLIEFALDLMHQDISAPTVFNGSAGIPEAFFLILHFIQQDTIMKPGDLSSNLLDDCLFGVSFGKFAHIKQVRVRTSPPRTYRAISTPPGVMEDALQTAHTLLLATNALLPYSLNIKELGAREDIATKVSRLADLLLDGLRSRES